MIGFIILLLFIGNAASAVAMVGEPSSSSKVDFSFVSDELNKSLINNSKKEKSLLEIN